jgi:rod shape-determining protein MreB
LVVGRGIVIKEPSVVARHRKTGAVLAIGTEAKQMVGKTPESIEALRPLKDGVIADFDAAEAMLTHYVRKLHQEPSAKFKLPRPRIVVGIPSGVTEVERRAVQEAALSAGARQAFLIEEPMATAIGAGLNIEEPEGRMIVDVGGGTAEIAVISLGGIVLGRSIRIAGDELDEAVINFARLKYGLVIGISTAEQIKIAVGSAYPFEKEGKNLQTVVRGREQESGLPKSMKFTSAEIREALAPTVQQIVQGITDVLEETPPELVADILKNGILLSGGSSLLRGLDKLVAEATKMPVWLAEDPQTSVVRGCGKVLENAELLKKVRVVGGLR